MEAVGRRQAEEEVARRTQEKSRRGKVPQFLEITSLRELQLLIQQIHLQQDLHLNAVSPSQAQRRRNNDPLASLEGRLGGTEAPKQEREDEDIRHGCELQR